MSNASPLSSLSLRRRPKPDLASFQAVLDLLPTPALLVEKANERILLFNTRWVELSTFSIEEMQKQNLADLFPGLKRRALFGIETGPALLPGAPDQPERENIDSAGRRGEIPASLARNKKPAIEVILTPIFLDPKKEWLLVALESADLRQQRQSDERRQARRLFSLKDLTQAGLANGLDEALEQTLSAGHDLTGAGLLGIYAGGSGEMLWKRCASLGDAETLYSWLPDEIGGADLLSLPRPALWMRGKRALTRIHRLARQAGLAYLATLPLGLPSATIGLLVAGGVESPPADLLALLEILAGVVTVMIQHEAQTGGLKAELQDQLHSLARAAAVIETSSDGIVVVAPDLTIVDLNPTAEVILGYASREVRGQPYANILVGADNLIPPFLTEQVSSEEETLIPPAVQNLGNVRLYRRDGRPFLAQVRTLPVIVDHRLASLVLLVADLSQEEQFRQRSAQLEQRALLGEVTAVFAHEVRNPINNISTGLQLMSLNLPSEDPNQEIIQRLQGDCDRLAELMKSVLAFARPVEYKMEPVDLGASIRRLVERWRPHMARVNVKHTVQIEPETPPTAGDVRALEQVWNNLISNSIQAMEEGGGTLSLKIHPVLTPDGGQRVEVSVLDTGPGIPEDVRERIFEPFFTTKRTGTGLGLAITKHIITAHKGSISVTSIPGGTVFQVQLPAVVD